eukprot:TRINITY_DN4228_c1_g1_i1.p2 TRINITY_DN4228_c1_g1~~TRINITY_DN4228_c1_g1_i1.p2  ORF type:complete len:148 (-),score=34.27 TRINITY_DN4228_c1_g1_i1:10-453(-)
MNVADPFLDIASLQEALRNGNGSGINSGAAAGMGGPLATLTGAVVVGRSSATYMDRLARRELKQERKRIAEQEKRQRRKENNYRYFDPNALFRLQQAVGENQLMEHVRVIHTALTIVRSSGCYFQMKTRHFFRCVTRAQRADRKSVV